MIFLIQLSAVLIIVSLQLVSCATQRTIESPLPPQQHDEEHLKNPLVFDLNTLYDKSRVAKSHPQLALDGKRFRRSAATSGKTQQPVVVAEKEQPHPLVVDACQSKVEVLTPYYATNSKGKIRTVVNSALMQQAIQVETCVR